MLCVLDITSVNVCCSQVAETMCNVLMLFQFIKIRHCLYEATSLLIMDPFDLILLKCMHTRTRTHARAKLTPNRNYSVPQMYL